MAENNGGRRKGHEKLARGHDGNFLYEEYQQGIIN